MRSESPDRIVVGIDDTDMPGTPGTGRLARRLGDEFQQRGVGTVSGVTRHQLFEGPGVPKTSHNSSAAIVLLDADPSLAASVGADCLLRWHAAGSDPGIAVLVGHPPADALSFARRAKRELVARAEASEIASACGVHLVGLAGTEDGIIGALSAAALRADGGDGRFVGLPGIRDLRGKMTVFEILKRSAVAAVVDEETFAPLDDDHVLDTCDWIRPRLVGHLPIVIARRSGRGWVHADARTGTS